MMNKSIIISALIGLSGLSFGQEYTKDSVVKVEIVQGDVTNSSSFEEVLAQIKSLEFQKSEYFLIFEKLYADEVANAQQLEELKVKIATVNSEIEKLYLQLAVTNNNETTNSELTYYEQLKSDLFKQLDLLYSKDTVDEIQVAIVKQQINELIFKIANITNTSSDTTSVDDEVVIYDTVKNPYQTDLEIYEKMKADLFVKLELVYQTTPIDEYEVKTIKQQIEEINNKIAYYHNQNVDSSYYTTDVKQSDSTYWYQNYAEIEYLNQQMFIDWTTNYTNVKEYCVQVSGDSAFNSIKFEECGLTESNYVIDYSELLKDSVVYTNKAAKMDVSDSQLYYRIGAKTENGTVWSSAEPINMSKVAATEESSMVSTSIFPNPAQDMINIESAEKINHVEIINQNGETVKDFNSQNVYNVSDLESGMYIVKITTATNTFTTRIHKL